jgi:hypothetical protein
MTRRAHAAAVLGLLVCSFGCTDAQLSPPEQQERSSIVNGTLSTDADNSVVLVAGPTNGCSGTLIAPNVVLTALHCVAQFDASARFTCNPDGSLMSSSPGSGQLGNLLTPSQIRVGTGVVNTFQARGKKIFGTSANQVCKDDLAVLVLDSNIDVGDATPVTLRFNRPTQKGDLTRIVGYGDTVFDAGAPGRRERDDIPILGVGEQDPSLPGDPNLVPHTILIGEGACHGDSGGPLFAEDTGAQIGVYSLLLSPSCVGSDVRNTYTQIAPFESTIRAALDYAGHTPLVEPPAPDTSGGEGGATGQGGEGNVVGEAGAAPSGGANDGSGGSSTASGGSGAVAGSTATAGTGDTTSNGDDTSGDDSMNQGSRSRRDPSCTCRSAGRRGGSLGSFVALLALGALVYRRRR